MGQNSICQNIGLGSLTVRRPTNVQQGGCRQGLHLIHHLPFFRHFFCSCLRSTADFGRCLPKTKTRPKPKHFPKCPNKNIKFFFFTKKKKNFDFKRVTFFFFFFGRNRTKSVLESEGSGRDGSIYPWTQTTTSIRLGWVPFRRQVREKN